MAAVSERVLNEYALAGVVIAVTRIRRPGLLSLKNPRMNLGHAEPVSRWEPRVDVTAGRSGSRPGHGVTGMSVRPLAAPDSVLLE